MTGTMIRFGDLYQIAQGGYRRASDGSLAQLISSLPVDAQLVVTTDGKTANVAGPSLVGGSHTWQAGDGFAKDPTAPVTQITFPGSGRRNVTYTVTDLAGKSRQLGAAVVIQNRSWQACYSTRHGQAAGVKQEWTAVESGTVPVEWEQTGGNPVTLPAVAQVAETAGKATPITANLTWPASASGRQVARVRTVARYPWGIQYGEDFGVVSVAATQPPAHDGVKVPFEPTSWVYADASTAPLAAETDFTGAPTQADLVKDVYDQFTHQWFPSRVPAFNAYQYTCAMAIADANTPRYDVTPIRNFHPDQLTGPAYYKQVPIPDYAVASAGTDGHIAIYDPTTDKLWEFWQFQWKDAQTPMAAWGGRIDNVSKSQAAYTAPFGVSASGLAFPALEVTIAEAKKAVAEAAAGRTTKGVINHCLYFATIWNAGKFCWPANRNDGGNGGKLYHGQRIRLSSTVDVDSLTAHPLAKAIAHALQRYGAVMADTAGQCNFGAESGLGPALRDGTNPWAAIESPKHDWDLLQGIPWDKVEVIKAGWRPDSGGGTTTPPAPTVQWWTADAPINKAIPANPVLDAESASISAGLAAGTSKAVAIADYGIPIRFPTSSTPRWTITPAQTGSWGDGTNPFAGRSIPIDKSWLTIPDADGHLVVVDGTTHYNLWGADLSGAAPACQWGGIGHSDTAIITEDGSGTSTAAGISRAAGVIREEEIAAGVINHALVFSSDICRPGVFRAPAKHTDGRTLRTGYTGATITQGARIQLDPTFTIPTTWPRYAQIVARALQVYGAYCVDNGGAAVSIMAELPKTATRDATTKVVSTNSTIYANSGLTEANRSVAMLPWDKVRVLAAWDGAGVTQALTATAVEDVPGEVLVSWTPAAGTATVSRDGVDATGDGPWTDTSTTGSYRFKQLVPGSTYTFTVTINGQTATTRASLKAANTPSTPVPNAQGLTGYYNLIYRDEFDGTALDTNVWTPLRGLPGGTYASPYNPDIENGSFAADRVSVSGGQLKLTWDKTPSTQYGINYDYTCGMVHSGKGFAFTFGFIEFKVYVTDSGDGIWPALWLIPTPVDRDWPPEIDIAEILNSDTPDGKLHPHFNVHWGTSSNPQQMNWQSYGPSGTSMGNGWHTIGMEWRADLLQVYYDGAPGPKYTVSANIPARDMYIVMSDGIAKRGINNALVYPDPGYMAIDYVRVWKQGGTAPAAQPLTDFTGKTFVANNGASATYHQWGQGRNQGAPLVIWLHGDAAFEHLNPTSTYCFGGSAGLAQKCKDRGLVLVSALAPDTTGTVTWWEDPDRNVPYLADLIAKLRSDINPSQIILAGYSGGAQFITEYYLPQRATTLPSGGSVVMGGGGKPITPSSPTFGAFPRSWWMQWTTGALDDATHSSEGYDALGYAKTGEAWYRGAGFATATSWPANTTHDLDGQFGALFAAAHDGHPDPSSVSVELLSDPTVNLVSGSEWWLWTGAPTLNTTAGTITLPGLADKVGCNDITVIAGKKLTLTVTPTAGSVGSCEASLSFFDAAGTYMVSLGGTGAGTGVRTSTVTVPTGATTCTIELRGADGDAGSAIIDRVSLVST